MTKDIFNRYNDKGIYFHGCFTPEELADYQSLTSHDVEELKRKSAQGDLEADCDLVNCYRFGFGGCEINNEEVLKIAHRLNNNNIGEGAHLIAAIYASDIFEFGQFKSGFKNKYEVIHDLHKRAVELEYYPSQILVYKKKINLICNFKRDLESVDCREMVEFYRKAIGVGYLPAKCDLYVISYMINNFGGQDIKETFNALVSQEEAFEFLRDSAVNDEYYDAQQWLSKYYQDRGQFAEALSFNFKAAKQGDKDSIKKICNQFSSDKLPALNCDEIIILFSLLHDESQGRIFSASTIESIKGILAKSKTNFNFADVAKIKEACENLDEFSEVVSSQLSPILKGLLVEKRHEAEAGSDNSHFRGQGLPPKEVQRSKVGRLYVEGSKETSV